MSILFLVIGLLNHGTDLDEKTSIFSTIKKERKGKENNIIFNYSLFIILERYALIPTPGKRKSSRCYLSSFKNK